MQKKFLLTVLLFSLLVGVLSLAGCSEGEVATILMADPDADSVVIEGVTLQRITELPPVWDIPPRPEAATEAERLTTTTLLQLTPLYIGELLAIMHTSEGDIAMRFFPTEAPMAVENFLTHAWDGFYDGIIFHRVIPNFMVQTGCPQGVGTGGHSIWGGHFGQEFSTELRHFRGALAMAQSAMPSSIGSQFYVVQNNSIDANTRSNYTSMLGQLDEAFHTFPDGSSITYGAMLTEDALNYFMDNGGTPHLDWHFNENGHTVFGHVVWGMEVVDSIANTSTGANDRPDNDITINGFSFFKVQGGV